MVRLLLTLLVVTCSVSIGCAKAPPKKVNAGEDQDNFDKNVPVFLAKIENAKTVRLYEGLPHQGWEKELLKKELAAKKTITLHDFPFYAEPITPTAEFARKLTAIARDGRAFELYVAPKKCGGYHPDWCIEWTNGDDAYRALLCFGCNEARLYGPKIDVFADVPRKVMDEFKMVLVLHRKYRPKTDEDQ